MNKEFIALNNDHKISYQTYGKGENTIILFHGLVGGSWLDPDTLPHINEANVRIVALERVGYGSSSQFELNNVNDWEPIIWQVIKELNITAADVIGISAGAPYAYASAFFLPNIIKKIWILSGVPAVYEESILAHYKENDQIEYKKFLETDVSEIQDYYVKQLQSYLNHFRENGKRHFIKTIEENINQKCYGMALESKLQILPWNIDLSKINQPVVMYHSKEDEMIPFMAAKEMSRNFKTCLFNEMPTSDDNVHIKSALIAFLEVLKEFKK